MKQRLRRRSSRRAFDEVLAVGLSLPDVVGATKYDGSPVLKARGCFVAGLASHPSAEPETLVVRSGFDERALLLEDAPETYYVTGYYEKYPVVLVRLSQINRDALRDLLSVSRRLALAKGRKRTSLVRASRARDRDRRGVV